MTNFEPISENAKYAILEGASINGNFIEAYEYAFEDLYTDEADEVREFCKWIDENIGGASRRNIDNLWLAFKYPHVKEFTDEANRIAEAIKRIKSLTL